MMSFSSSNTTTTTPADPHHQKEVLLVNIALSSSNRNNNSDVTYIAPLEAISPEQQQQQRITAEACDPNINTDATATTTTIAQHSDHPDAAPSSEGGSRGAEATAAIRADDDASAAPLLPRTAPLLPPPHHLYQPTMTVTVGRTAEDLFRLSHPASAASATLVEEAPPAVGEGWIALPSERCRAYLSGRPVCNRIPCRFFHGRECALAAARMKGHNAYRPADGRTAFMPEEDLMESEELSRITKSMLFASCPVSVFGLTEEAAVTGRAKGGGSSNNKGAGGCGSTVNPKLDWPVGGEGWMGYQDYFVASGGAGSRSANDNFYNASPTSGTARGTICATFYQGSPCRLGVACPFVHSPREYRMMAKRACPFYGSRDTKNHATASHRQCARGLQCSFFHGTEADRLRLVSQGACVYDTTTMEAVDPAALGRDVRDDPQWWTAERLAELERRRHDAVMASLALASKLVVSSASVTDGSVSPSGCGAIRSTDVVGGRHSEGDAVLNRNGAAINISNSGLNPAAAAFNVAPLSASLGSAASSRGNAAAGTASVVNPYPRPKRDPRPNANTVGTSHRSNSSSCAKGSGPSSPLATAIIPVVDVSSDTIMNASNGSGNCSQRDNQQEQQQNPAMLHNNMPPPLLMNPYANSSSNNNNNNNNGILYPPHHHQQRQQQLDAAALGAGGPTPMMMAMTMMMSGVPPPPPLLPPFPASLLLPPASAPANGTACSAPSAANTNPMPMMMAAPNHYGASSDASSAYLLALQQQEQQILQRRDELLNRQIALLRLQWLQQQQALLAQLLQGQQQQVHPKLNPHSLIDGGVNNNINGIINSNGPAAAGLVGLTVGGPLFPTNAFSPAPSPLLPNTTSPLLTNPNSHSSVSNNTSHATVTAALSALLLATDTTNTNTSSFLSTPQQQQSPMMAMNHHPTLMHTAIGANGVGVGAPLSWGAAAGGVSATGFGFGSEMMGGGQGGEFGDTASAAMMVEYGGHKFSNSNNNNNNNVSNGVLGSW